MTKLKMLEFITDKFSETVSETIDTLFDKLVIDADDIKKKYLQHFSKPRITKAVQYIRELADFHLEEIKDIQVKDDNLKQVVSQFEAEYNGLLSTSGLQDANAVKLSKEELVNHLVQLVRLLLHYINEVEDVVDEMEDEEKEDKIASKIVTTLKKLI